MTTARIAARPVWRVWLKRIGLLAVLGIAALVAASVLSGYGLNLRGFGRSVIDMTRAVLESRSVTENNQGDFRNVVFLHKSVGKNLIEEGGVRERLAAAGYQLWDQGYNWQGLHNPEGQRTGYAYTLPDDNSEPSGLKQLFTQPVYGLPLNALSGLLQHEVIIFKSCFPASHIADELQLEQHKEWYREIRDTMDRHPGKLFVVVTQPPLNPRETDAAIAARARIFANWLKSEEFLKGHPNVVTYDLFDQLAERDPQRSDFNMLRQSYREGGDSHPTRIANEAIGPQFADFVIDAIEQYKQHLGQ